MFHKRSTSPLSAEREREREREREMWSSSCLKDLKNRTGEKVEGIAAQQEKRPWKRAVEGNHGGAAAEQEKRPLKRVTEAFVVLAAGVESCKARGGMELAPFVHACSLVSAAFGCLGVGFKFAELDYVAKIKDLEDASKSISTLEAMLQLDLAQGRVRKAGSHSRNLLRVKRGLDMLRVLLKQIIATEGDSLRDPAAFAYAQVFAPHHPRILRVSVAKGMFSLPTKTQLLKKLNEEDASEARSLMRKYIDASAPIIRYVEDLFLSRNLGIDW